MRRARKRRAAGAPLLEFPAPEGTVLSTLCNDGSPWHITQAQIDRWRELYPATDVDHGVREAVGWLESHPKQRKTRVGMNGYFTGWLGRNQNRARAAGGNGRPTYEDRRRAAVAEAERMAIERGEEP